MQPSNKSATLHQGNDAATDNTHLVNHNQHHEVASAKTENKRRRKQREKEEQKNSVLFHQRTYTPDGSEEDSNEESTGDQNIISEPNKYKKIKLNENEKTSNSITPKEKEKLAKKEKEVEDEDENQRIISENNDDNEDDNNTEYDDLPVNGRSTLSLKKVYKKQAKHISEPIQVEEKDELEEDEIDGEDEEDDEEDQSDNDDEDKEKEEEDDDESDEDQEDEIIEEQHSNKIKICMGFRNSKSKFNDDEDDSQQDDEENDIEENEKDKDEQEEDQENEEEEEEDDDDEDEDYEVTEEDIIQQRQDRVLTSKWTEDTLKKLEIDELDEPIEEDQDIEGFDIEQIMKDERKKQYIENLMECLPPYMYCTSQEEKDDFFEKLNKEFKRNLSIDSNPLKHSHKKRVKFNFQKAQVVEFDLTKKVKNISKLFIKEGITEIKTN